VLDPIAGFDPRRRLIGADFFALEFSLVRSRHRQSLVLIPIDSLDCAASVGFSSTGALRSMPSIEPVKQAAALYLGGAAAAMLAFAASGGNDLHGIGRGRGN